MRLANYCPHCKKRRFLSEEGLGKAHYPPPRLWKKVWLNTLGYYPFGKYYYAFCDLCNRKLAVFDQHIFKQMKGKPIVFYRCTLTDRPYNKDYCVNFPKCRKCPALKKENIYGRR